MRAHYFILLLLITGSKTFAGLPIKKICDLPASLYESSGIELYKDKYLISINDSGNKAELFVLNLKGELLKRIEITNAKNEDWEDLTIDDKGNIYIADIGNNLNQRKKLYVYKLDGKILESGKRKAEAKIIELKYDDQKKFPPKIDELNYDAEAIIWKDDSLFIFTKCRTEPFTGKSFIYAIPDKPGKYKTRPKAHFQFCDSGWRNCSVVSADYDPTTKTLVVLLYGKLYFITGFKGNNFWEGKMNSFNIFGIKQREAICFGGKYDLFMTDEYRRPIGGGNLYRISLK